MIRFFCDTPEEEEFLHDLLSEIFAEDLMEMPEGETPENCVDITIHASGEKLH